MGDGEFKQPSKIKKKKKDIYDHSTTYTMHMM